MNAADGSFKIMIVDDHAGMRRIVRRYCELLAREFIECESGESAVKAFAEHAPDWTIMDLRMGGMDGLAATAAIRHESPGARIIIISQFDEPELQARARAAGALEFVSKENLSVLSRIIQSTSNPSSS